MKITAQEEYGLRCILQLAHYSPGVPVAVTEIAEREGLSTDYVTKLLVLLRRAGLVESIRGVHGGYTLAKNPKDIPLIEVLQALDEGSFFYHDAVDEIDLCRQFPGKLTECTHVKQCGIRPVWLMLMEYIHKIFSHMTLAHLLKDEECIHDMMREPVQELIQIGS